MLNLSNKVADAREAMAALIQSRSLSVREDEPQYPERLAELAWLIADAMSAQWSQRSPSLSPPMPPSSGKHKADR